MIARRAGEGYSILALLMETLLMRRMV